MTDYFRGTSIDDTVFCIVVNEYASPKDDFKVTMTSGVITTMTDHKGENVSDDVRNLYSGLITNLGYVDFTGNLFLQVT